ncbi:MAG TPA: YlxR family protein [Acidimicrobiales bacterium]|nr:YlxR family protein [Acidimicrobiales bacterium]
MRAGSEGALGPLRTCVGCRRRRSTGELVRVVCRPDGSLAFGRHLPGRGAWLCAVSTGACLAASLRRNGLSRALRRPLEQHAIEELQAALEA